MNQLNAGLLAGGALSTVGLGWGMGGGGWRALIAQVISLIRIENH